MINKIKTLRKDSGFTIVELLIVIVVIGILAAITIVSYTGITQKANTTKAQTNAVAVQKVAETYFAENGAYPTAAAHFTSGSATLPTGVKLIAVEATTPLTATNGLDSVRYMHNASGTGATINYYDFTSGASNPIVINLGAGGGTTAVIKP